MCALHSAIYHSVDTFVGWNTKSYSSWWFTADQFTIIHDYLLLVIRAAMREYAWSVSFFTHISLCVHVFVPLLFRCFAGRTANTTEESWCGGVRAWSNEELVCHTEEKINRIFSLAMTKFAAISIIDVQCFVFSTHWAIIRSACFSVFDLTFFRFGFFFSLCLSSFIEVCCLQLTIWFSNVLRSLTCAHTHTPIKWIF